MSKKWLLKIAGTIGVLLLLTAALLILFHPAGSGVSTMQQLPDVDDRAVYVECVDRQPVEVKLHTKEAFSVSGFSLLLVNLSEESQGTFEFHVRDASGELLLNQEVPIGTFTPGEWTTLSGEMSFEADQDYQVSFVAKGSEPYFMQVPQGGGESLPFEQEVTQGGELLDCGISLGVNTITQTTLTYGDIFYHSVLFCVLGAVFLLLLIWIGAKRLKQLAQGFFAENGCMGKSLKRFGSDGFLVLLFGGICISIYSRAYLEGVFISADSAGYLREAVALVEGQGFSYDGLAGYQSWFANWPILYPLMIAGVMLLTGTNAYLASKITAMVMIGLMLLFLRLFFRKDAWVYALCLLNPGFLELSYYTWSEIPFILFLLSFGLALSRILTQEEPQKRWYVLLGLSGMGCFLTRYFGIYVWVVAGLYLLCLIGLYWREKKKSDLRKSIGLGITAGISGLASMGYLFMNRQMNGMASGVSRTMWWDDYGTLTNDLIESLLVEIFHVFSLSIPEWLENFPFSIKVWVLIAVGIGVGWLVVKNCRLFSTESVMVSMAVVYYGMFIVIRYFSSMDTFYFRFFEPATFLLCIGLVGMVLPWVREKKPFRYFAGVVTLLVVLSVWTTAGQEEMQTGNGYYHLLTRQWDGMYEEIPEKSVIIFDDIDFRSTWYRPDVVEGLIRPEDTMDSLHATWYGSDFLCIKAEFAEAMIESGEYDAQVEKWLTDGLEALAADREYLVLSLKE